MDTRRWYRLSLTIVGVMIGIAAIFHGLWYWFFPGYSEMKGLAPVQWDTIYLFNWSIACFLFFMAIITIIVAGAKSLSLKHLRIFSAWLFLFWACRLVLEFIFPARIPFVFIPEPSMFLKILMIIALAIMLIPELINMVTTIRNSKSKE